MSWFYILILAKLYLKCTFWSKTTAAVWEHKLLEVIK